MKPMIRLSAILLAFLLLAACSKPTPTPTDPTPRPTDPSVSEPTQAPTEPPALYDYENASLGIFCNLSENWEIADFASLGEMSGVIAETVTVEAMQRQFETNGAVYDFYAENSEGDSFVITRENLALLPIPEGSDTFNHLVQRVLHALDGLEIAEPSIEKCVVALAGKQYSGIETHYDYNGTSYHQRVVVILLEDTAWYLTVTSVGEDRTDTMLSVFQSL